MSIIDTYSNDIYEWDLVVANKDVNLVRLRELFITADGKELPESIMDNSATTISVTRKKDGKPCCLVKFNCYGVYCKTSKEKMNWLVNTAGHEATHYALDIYYSIDSTVCTTHQEPFAYLVGWATQCIYNTWTKRKNDTLQKRKQTKG